jgi:hypothetical protein
MTISAQESLDREAITDKIYRYCRSVDRLDVPLGHTVFHPDSVADFGIYKGSGRGWIDFICKEHLNYLHHSHQVTNIIIEIDGDQANSEAYVTATLRLHQDGKLIRLMIWARYVDEWSRRDGEWAIDKRDCVVDFDERMEVTPMSESYRARRDRTDPSYATFERGA